MRTTHLCTDSRGGEMDSHFLMGVWQSSGRPCGTKALVVAIYGKYNMPYILGNLSQSRVQLSDLLAKKSITFNSNKLMNRTEMPTHLQ